MKVKVKKLIKATSNEQNNMNTNDLVTMRDVEEDFYWRMVRGV